MFLIPLNPNGSLKFYLASQPLLIYVIEQDISKGHSVTYLVILIRITRIRIRRVIISRIISGIWLSAPHAQRNLIYSRHGFLFLRARSVSRALFEYLEDILNLIARILSRACRKSEPSVAPIIPVNK